MLNLFHRKKEDIITTPCSGFVMELEEVKDPMFSQKLLGDGFAIAPEDDIICAPCDGTLTMIANTAHAFGITTHNDAEILIHVGLDTVMLNGNGFTVLAKINQKVKAGTPILKLDLPFMKKQNLDITIPVVLTNGTDYSIKRMMKKGEADCTQQVLSIVKS